MMLLWSYTGILFVLTQWLLLVFSEVAMIKREHEEERDEISSSSAPSLPVWTPYKRTKGDDELKRQQKAARKAKNAASEKKRRAKKKLAHQQLQEEVATSR